MVKVSDYQIGAFEALKWTWHILRKCDEKPNGIEDARDAIRETLFRLGRGDIIKFDNHPLDSITNNEPTSTVEVYDG